MCSINGFTFQDKDLIQKMNHVTKHRGPDSTNFFIDEGISLGHNRLSIIDTREVANQPMLSSDKRFVIVFNGEIYNFQEIKKDLSDFEFKTNGDTEVILNGFQKWGTEIFSKLNGMYALAIWDSLNKELILARDPRGIKPLYYLLEDNNLIFSSEIKAILKHNMERVLDINAFNIYLSNLYVPAPLTMFKNIFKLEPGTILNFKNGKIDKQKIIYKSESNENDLEKIIDNAIERQLISDKPVGVFLSGGLDSSIVLDSVSKVHKNIDTFSVSFELGNKEEEKKFNIDANLAKKTSEIYGTNHNEIKVGVEDVINCLEDVVYQMDEPIANPTVVPTYLLSEFTKNKVDVVLGGDGSDELFGGYERYRLSLIADFYQKIIPRFLRSKLELFDRFRKLNIKKYIDRYALFHFQSQDEINKIIKSEFLNNFSYEFFESKIDDNNKSFTNHLLELDQQFWLIDESLMRSDKMTMAHSLEQRVPFLDLEIVEFSKKISLHKKVGFIKNKKILRKIFKKRLPEYLFNQPKRGWFSPSAKWMRDPKMLSIIKSTLSENYYEETNRLFDWDNVQKMLDDHVEGRVYNRSIIWAIFVFQIWAKKYQVKI